MNLTSLQFEILTIKLNIFSWFKVVYVLKYELNLVVFKINKCNNSFKNNLKWTIDLLYFCGSKAGTCSNFTHKLFY